MDSPPFSALILKPKLILNVNSSIGIDTKFISYQPYLKGIKGIPPGLHFFHFSLSLEEGASMRYGWWFEIKENLVLTIEWDTENALFISTEVNDSIISLYSLMIEYPESKSNWASLSHSVNSSTLRRYFPSAFDAISTATPLVEENRTLIELIRQRQPEFEAPAETRCELNYTMIEKHKQKENSLGSELTSSHFDRTWYFLHLFGSDWGFFLAELQLAHLHFILLGNLCSYTQWMSLVLLLLSCEEYLSKDASKADEFLILLYDQLETIPKEYLAPELSFHVLEMESYLRVVSNFSSFLAANNNWKKIENFNAKNFGMTSIKQCTFDEDNFEVYVVDDHTDEYTPAIVFD